MRKYFILVCLLCALLSTSCATVFCGSKAKVTFESNVDQADLTIDGRKHNNVTFPYTTKIARGFDETIVKAEKEGYETQLLYVDKSSIQYLLLILQMCWDGVLTQQQAR